ncbi:MAG TPA: response regulator transcription factor [Gaiella sp.]|jgi:DNA-binding NarL/FixJ family response regulator
MAGVEGSVPARGRPARVLAVDDDPSFLALLCDVVDASRELELVGETDCGERAVQAAAKLRPDVVLMDVRMPRLDGISATTRIKAGLPSTLVVLVSVTHPDELRREASGCGASAILWKADLRPSLLDEIWRRHVEAVPSA